MKERIDILQLVLGNQGALINGCFHIYGAYQHRTRFHKDSTVNANTDDGVNPERDGPSPVIQMAVTVTNMTELQCNGFRFGFNYMV